MNYPNYVRALYDPLRYINYSVLMADTFIAVGAPFTNAIRAIKFNNTTDANLIVSYDGITYHDFIVANGAFVFDISSNKANQGGYLEMPANGRPYVMLETGAAATEGNVYVTVIYAAPN